MLIPDAMIYAREHNLRIQRQGRRKVPIVSENVGAIQKLHVFVHNHMLYKLTSSITMIH